MEFKIALTAVVIFSFFLGKGAKAAQECYYCDGKCADPMHTTKCSESHRCKAQTMIDST